MGVIVKLKQWKRNNLFRSILEEPILINPVNVLNSLFEMFNLPYQIPILSGLVLYVNNICNAKCMMCDIGQQNSKGIDLLRARQKNKELDMELLKKLIEDPYIRNKRIDFCLLMTEPLLSENICEMVSLIKSRDHKATLITNGFLLPKKAKSLIEAGLDSIQVSIDGTEEIHDKIRGVSGFYRNAIEGIRILNSSKVKVTINYTVFDKNCHCITDFLSDINKQVKVDKVKLQFMNFVSDEMKKRHNNRYSIKHTMSSISDESNLGDVDVNKLSEQLRSINPSSYENIGRIDIIPYITSKKELDKYFNTNGEKLENNSRCFLPWRSLAVTTDGKIIPHMRCFDLVLGDLNNSSLKEIFEGPKYKDFRNKLKKANYCFPACTRCCGVMRYGFGPK